MSDSFQDPGAGGDRIRPAGEGDLPAILALLGRCGLPADGLADHRITTLLAQDGERLVGCAAVEPYGEVALLRSVAVDPAFRGRGLGVQVTRAALDLAAARGFRVLYLLTTTADEFFARFGFRRIPRGAVDPAVRSSVEFTTACPESARAMQLDLRP